METQKQIYMKQMKVILVLILPMRNGNSISFLSNPVISSSYPTYEEWKLPSAEDFGHESIGSYPTYEEWKPRFLNKLLVR